MSILNFILIVIITILLILLIKKRFDYMDTINKLLIEKNLDFNTFNKEFHLFSLIIITRMITERLIQSKKDENGNLIALREISSINDPFYSGMVISVIGSMSNSMKDKFYTFYRKTKNNSLLVTEISAIIESYSFVIIQRLKNIELELNDSNREIVKSGKSPIESKEYVNTKLIESVINDNKTLNVSLI